MAALVWTILYLLVVIGALTTATYYNGQVLAMQEMGIENQERMERIESALQAEFLDERDGGLVYAAAGNDGADYYHLPDVDVPRTTPWGVPYQYCPVAPSEAVTGSGSRVEVSGANDFSYNVDVEDGFVVRSDQAFNTGIMAEGVVAFVVSPAINSNEMPDCDGVVVADGGFRLPGGIVVAVRRDSSFEKGDGYNGRTVRWFVAANGTGSGASVTDASGIDAALRFFGEAGPAEMEIVLSAEEHFVSEEFLSVDGFTGFGAPQRSLKLIGPGATLRAADSSGTVVTGTLDLDADVEVVDIVRDNGLKLRVAAGNNLRLINSNGGPVLVDGGSLFARNSIISGFVQRKGGVTTLDWSQLREVDIYSGDLIARGYSRVFSDTKPYALEVKAGVRVMVTQGFAVYGRSGLGGLRVHSGGVVELANGGLDVRVDGVGSLAYGVYIDSGGKFLTYKGGVNFMNFVSEGFRNYGEIRLVDTPVRFEAGGTTAIVASYGARITLDGATQLGVGTWRPERGVYADHAAKMTGDGQVNVTGWCWAGNNFSYAGSSRSLISSVNLGYADEAVRREKMITNQSGWYCNVS